MIRAASSWYWRIRKIFKWRIFIFWRDERHPYWQ